jgi:hypothetical protein
MKKKRFTEEQISPSASAVLAVAIFGLVATALPSRAGGDERSAPQAPARSHAANYRDFALARCIATAYRADPYAAKDARTTAGALIEWTNHDLEAGDDALEALVQKYLARDYHNPVAEGETRDARFDLLKCLDLYHSGELETQVRRFVSRPTRSYRQDVAPPTDRRK